MKLLNSLDIAELLRIEGTDKQKKKKIQNLLQTNVLPRTVTIKIGRSVRFVESELEKWLENKYLGCKQ